MAKGTNNQITEPIAKLLQDKNFASLSTLMSDGSPQVTPTWVDVDIEDNVILINTTEGRLKIRIYQGILELHFRLRIVLIYIIWLL